MRSLSWSVLPEIMLASTPKRLIMPETMGLSALPLKKDRRTARLAPSKYSLLTGVLLSDSGRVFLSTLLTNSLVVWFCSLVLRVGKYVHHIAFFYNAAVFNNGYAVADFLHNFHLVRNHYYGKV